MSDKQKQHIIPEVYLKQFGYQYKGGIWKVPTFNMEEIELMNRLDKTIIKQSTIKSLLQEINIFDIPEIKENKKLLENFLKLTEDHYPKVMNEVQSDQLISANTRSMLLGFISLLFTRSPDYRLILRSVIQDKDMVYLKGIMDGDERRISIILNLPIESGINYLIAFSAGFIFKIIQNFRVSIIKNIPGEKWATTDNPVTVICKADNQKRLDFMGVDTKILFPMSPEYLAYLDHKDSSINLITGLEHLKENQINEIGSDAFTNIWLRVTDKSRITKYLILPAPSP